MKKIKKLLKKQGFTLVELIIVIAIIAVLAVAAFMMLTKWLGHSRDARKIGDVATIKKALNIAFVEKPMYPEPEDKGPIKDLDGNVLWYQGVFGVSSSNEIDTLQKAPVNPTDDNYYTYSVTTDQKEYQIGVWLENGEEVSFANSVFAVEGFARIEGEYDGYVTYSSGTDGKIIKIPTLILTDGDTIDLSGSNTNLMIEGKSEGEPFEVKNVAFNPENVDNDKLINDIKTTFGVEDDKAAMLVIEDNSSITPSAIIYAGCDSDIRTINGRVYNVPAMSHGGSKAVNVEDGSFTNGTKYWTVTFSCNAETLSEGTETEVINCTDGFVESNGACELDKCDGDIPDNAESNATSTGIGTTRNYTTIPGKCTYECSEGFHTEDGGTTCVSDTKELTCGGSIDTNGIKTTGDTYTQTWDGSAWSSTVSRGESQTDCDFDCDSGYIRDGSVCVGQSKTDCMSWKAAGYNTSKTYLIKSDSGEAFETYCDMTTEGGGWTQVMSIADVDIGDYDSRGTNVWNSSTSVIDYISTSNSFKFNDTMISTIRDGGKYMIKATATGRSNTYYVPETCNYNHQLGQNGSCATLYSDVDLQTLVCNTATNTGRQGIGCRGTHGIITNHQDFDNVGCYHAGTGRCTNAGESITIKVFVRRADFSEDYAAETSCLAHKNKGRTINGIYKINPGGTSIDAYCDMTYNGGGRTLIGRGREDWAWNNSGKNTSNVSMNIGTTSAFVPAYYSSTVVDGIIGKNVNTLTDGIRIRRAVDTTGTTYQEIIRKLSSQTDWTWMFPDILSLNYYSLNGISKTIIGNTRDTMSGGSGPNDSSRIFTWIRSSHASKTGFSYGSTVTAGTNSATNYLREYSTENHSIPYTEVYVRN